MNKAEQMTVVFTAGYLAGILCAVVSHPADTLVSKINKLTMEGSLGQKVLPFPAPRSFLCISVDFLLFFVLSAALSILVHLESLESASKDFGQV